MEVSLEELVFDPFQLRVRIDDVKLDRLKGSILQVGLLLPLKVWFNEGKYWIVDGNYRYRALKEIQREKAPVDPMPEGTTYPDALLAAIISNWHRAEFRFMDKARSVRRLREQNVDDITICARLELPLEKGKPGRLFRYYREFEDYVPDGAKGVLEPRFHAITRRHAQALVIIRGYPDKQKDLAIRVVTEGLSGPEALREADKVLHPEKYVKVELKCEFRDYISALAKTVRESLPEEASCDACAIHAICQEYKKAILELANEIKAK